MAAAMFQTTDCFYEVIYQLLKFMDKVFTKDISATEMGISNKKKSFFGFYWSLTMKLLQKTAKGVIIESKKLTKNLEFTYQNLN